jgi:integrase
VEAVEQAKHVWSKGKLKLSCIRTRGDVDTPVIKTLDLVGTGYRRGGLLEEMLASSECPMSDQRGYKLIRLLKASAHDADIKRIFNTAIAKLFPRDISKLLSHLDDVFDGYGGISKSTEGDNIRHFLVQCRVRLADGELIENLKLTSRHKPARKTESPEHNVYVSDIFDENFLAKELSSIDFKDLAERDEKAKAILHKSASETIAVCENIITRHDELVRHLERLSNTKLPESIPKRIRDAVTRGSAPRRPRWKKLPPEDLLHLHTAILDKAESHKGNRISPIFPEKLNQFWSLPNCLPLETCSMLLSRHYLPRTVVTACVILLLDNIGWNWATLMTVNLDNIIKDDSGYTIQGVKYKTGQIQKAELTDLPEADNEGGEDDEDDEEPEEGFSTMPSKRITEPLCTHALELLIQHRRNIDKYFEPKSKSIFVSMRFVSRDSSTFLFSVGRLPTYLKVFCRLTGLEEFSFSDLRHRAAHIRYLASGRDIIQTQLFLGHAAADVTTVYLNSTIIRLLGEANLLKYVTLLSDCVFYATGRKDKLDAKQLARVKKNNLLLFPPSTLEDKGVDCIADRWVDSFGKMPFRIGKPEVAHIALQYRLYTRNLPALVQAGHERFVARHLPRIVFCCALYQVVAVGPLSQELKRVEAGYEKSS